MNLEQHYADLRRMSERLQRLLTTVLGVSRGINEAAAETQDIRMQRLADDLHTSLESAEPEAAALVEWARLREKEVEGRTGE